MTQKEYINEMIKNFNQCVAIAKAKNADYAKPTDAFANFRGAEFIGVDPRIGILIRMTDKIKRVSNLLNTPAHVKDESVGDTLLDLANYAIILKIMYETR